MQVATVSAIFSRAASSAAGSLARLIMSEETSSSMFLRRGPHTSALMVLVSLGSMPVTTSNSRRFCWDLSSRRLSLARSVWAR